MYYLAKAAISDWKTATIPETYLVGMAREISVLVAVSGYAVSGGRWDVPLAMLAISHVLASFGETMGADRGGRAQFASADSYAVVSLLVILSTLLWAFFYGLLAGYAGAFAMSACVSGFFTVLAYHMASSAYGKVLRSDVLYNPEWRMCQPAGQEVVFGNASGAEPGTLALTPENFQANAERVAEYRRIRFSDGEYEGFSVTLAGSFVNTPTGKAVFNGHMDPDDKKAVPYLPFLVSMLFLVAALSLALSLK